MSFDNARQNICRALRNVTFIPPLSFRLRCRCPIPKRGRLKPKRAVAPDGPLFLWADTERTRLNDHYRSVPCYALNEISRCCTQWRSSTIQFENPPRNSMRYVTRPAFLCVGYNYTQRSLELTVDNSLDDGLHSVRVPECHLTRFLQRNWRIAFVLTRADF